MKISFNGKILNEKDAPILISNKAVWYDFGVYETVKVLQGVLFYPQLHIDRLFESARYIDLNIGIDKEELIDWVVEFKESQNLHDHLIKMCVYGDATDNRKANIYIFALGLTFHPDSYYRGGVSAILLEGERFIPRSKTLNSLRPFLAHRAARREGHFEALMVDREGNVREGASSNLFVVKNGEVITTGAQHILEGVTRSLTVSLAKENGIETSEKFISKSALFASDEAFVTGTVINIMPIVSVDGKTIGTGVVGPIAKKLQKYFSDHQKKYMQDNKI